MKLFNEEKFERIWVSRNKDGKYGEDKKLTDTEYIDYHIWEDQNYEQLYKKHLPNITLIRGINPNIIFHGGCLGCLSQRKHGIERCEGCQYFKADWSKPNLFIEGEDSAKMGGDDFKNLLK